MTQNQPELPGRIIIFLKNSQADTGKLNDSIFYMIKSCERSNYDWIGNWKVSYYQNILHIASYEFYIDKNLVNGQIQRLVVLPLRNI